MRTLVLAGACVALICGAAAAQISNYDKFQQFIAADPYMGWLAARLNEFEPLLLKAECEALKIVKREIYFPVKEAAFNNPDSELPSTGQWIDRVSVDRCGKPAIRNIFVTVNEKQKLLNVQSMIPGITATPPILQRSALNAATAEARLKSGCNDNMVVTDSAIAGRFVDGAPWREDWSFFGCGKTIVIEVAFTPDPRGGSKIAVKPK